MDIRARRGVVRLLWVACLLFAAPSFADDVDQTQSAEVERRATSIARTTQSPFCPGKTLDACPSPSAAEWRQDIRAWVQQGDSNEEIRSRLQARTPEVDLSGHPLGARSWLLPLIAVGVVTLGFGWWILRARRRFSRSVASEDGEEDATDPLDARLDAELKSLDR